MFKYIFVVAALLVSGCASKYPGDLSNITSLANNESVILVGVKGDRGIRYLQYCHSKPPCYEFYVETGNNDVIGLPIAVPVSALELTAFTYSDVSAGYLPDGSSYGFTAVNDTPVDVAETGILYHMTIDTDQARFDPKPNAQLIKQAYEKYGSKLDGLKPLNFSESLAQ